MKALILRSAGKPLELAEVPRPEPAAGEVLVRIRASGVNPLDTKIRAGKAAHARHPLPAILGIDLAGTVEAVGSAVSSWQRGDDVFGMAGGVGGVPGSLAQFAAVDARLLARKPANVSMREAAALPLIFITAWEGLVDRVGLRAKQSLLVLGGGRVGSMAVQIARAHGATVVAAVSASKANLIRSYGAVPVDLAATTINDLVTKHTDGKGFDVVYDTLGGSSLDTAFSAVKRFGHVVSCLGWGTHALSTLSFKAATYSGVFTLLPLLTGEGRDHHGEILRAAADLVEGGSLKVRLDPRTFTLQRAAEAHELIEQRRADGKLVVEID
jgi:NADPH2:quinone reductase